MELKQAEKLSVNYAFISPVLTTASHPNKTCLGWSNFRQLAEQVNFPVYALCSKVSINQDMKSINDLCTRIIVNEEIDLYGCCADEFAKFGD